MHFKYTNDNKIKNYLLTNENIKYISLFQVIHCSQYRKVQNMDSS